MHRLPFADYVPPVEQTARFCQMTWEPPIIVHGSHRLSDDDLRELGQRYRSRLQHLAHETRGEP
jgi:glutathione-regulated potassium-efflux system ancillary protein KefF